MPIPQEVQNWIDEMKKAGLSDDDLKPLLTKAEANEALGNALKGSVTATADYQRNIQAAKEAEAKAKAELEATTKWRNDLGSWETESRETLLAHQEARERAEAELGRVRGRLAVLKDSYQISDDDLLGVVEPQKTAVEPPAAHPAKNYLTNEEFRSQTEKIVRMVPKVENRLMKLWKKHERLFEGVKDAPEFDPDIVFDKAIEMGKTVDEVASELYKFPEREQAIQEASISKRIEDEVQLRLTKKLGEQAATGGKLAQSIIDKGSPLLRVLERKPESEKRELPARTEPPSGTAARRVDRVNRAVQRYAERLASGQPI